MQPIIDPAPIEAAATPALSEFDIVRLAKLASSRARVAEVERQSLAPMGASNELLLRAFLLHMRTAQLAPATITARLEVVGRLAAWLHPVTLLDATPRDLQGFQESFVHLARASIDIYSRHAVALYRWAVQYDYLDADPTGRMVRIPRRRGIPHPIKEDDLRIVLACSRACSRGGLRMAYVLAAFVGLRCGEITRLGGGDLTLDAAQPVAHIQGKGGLERIVPLIPPVVAELRAAGFPRNGRVVVHRDGTPYSPEQLSVASTTFMHSIGVTSTLHSCRHYFATEVVKLTKDILLVRDLLGHSSVSTTQIYTLSTAVDGVQDRLAAFSDTTSRLIANTAPQIGHAVADLGQAQL